MTDVVPGRYRKLLYALYSVTGVVVGSLTVAFDAAGALQPQWLVVTVAVYAYLGGVFGSLAGGNTDGSDVGV